MLLRLGAVRADRLAAGVLGLGAAVTCVISLALCGIHVRNDRDTPQPRPAKVGWGASTVQRSRDLTLAG